LPMVTEMIRMIMMIIMHMVVCHAYVNLRHEAGPPSCFVALI
jgi:hypothetical protein